MVFLIAVGLFAVIQFEVASADDIAQHAIGTECFHDKLYFTPREGGIVGDGEVTFDDAQVA